MNLKTVFVLVPVEVEVWTDGDKDELHRECPVGSVVAPSREDCNEEVRIEATYATHESACAAHKHAPRDYAALAHKVADYVEMGPGRQDLINRIMRLLASDEQWSRGQ